MIITNIYNNNFSHLFSLLPTFRILYSSLLSTVLPSSADPYIQLNNWWLTRWTELQLTAPGGAGSTTNYIIILVFNDRQLFVFSHSASQHNLHTTIIIVGGHSRFLTRRRFLPRWLKPNYTTKWWGEAILTTP